jgi:hypothetical protein
MTEIEMTSLLVNLANYDITGILITYTGGGGDGQIDDIVYTTEELNIDHHIALSRMDSIALYTPRAIRLIDLDLDLYNTLCSFVMDNILQTVDDLPDWYNDDGGYGTLSMLVPSGKYEIINTIYITETDTTRHEGDLLSKTEK